MWKDNILGKDFDTYLKVLHYRNTCIKNVLNKILHIYFATQKMSLTFSYLDLFVPPLQEIWLNILCLILYKILY